jgi:hypothetical protein
MVKGRCEVTGIFLSAREVHCHHIKPYHLGGTDRFNNLMIMHKEIHSLIHAKQPMIIEKFLERWKLTKKQIEKINKLRKVKTN